MLTFYHTCDHSNVDVNLLINFLFVAFLQKIGKESSGMCFLICIYVLHLQKIFALIDIIYANMEIIRQ